MSNNTSPRLDVRNLRTEYHTDDGTITPVNDVSFAIAPGETFGLVGESGAGKSVTTRSIMQLIESPGEITGGEVLYDDRDLLELSETEMQRVRGNDIALIPQDPMTALNPVLSVGEQIIETICKHQDSDRESARADAIEVMREVGIPDASDRIDDYPHEFSGGMRQRILVAIALACEPKVLIADEPTTALDVTTETKILDLFNELQEAHGLSILLITHDMGVVAQTCDRVGVLYAGHMVERGPVGDIFQSPQHPYTRALLDSIPDLAGSNERLYALEGSMPELTSLEDGCNFAPRCPHATEACRSGDDPKLEPCQNSRTEAACIHRDDLDLSEAVEAGEVATDGSVSRGVVRSNDERPLLEIEGLKKHFDNGGGLLGSLSVSRTDGLMPTLERERVRAVDGVSFSLQRGETLGLVGESGCGKSTVAKTVLQLLNPTEGKVYFDNTPLHELSSGKIRSLRADMQMIFQDPQSSLNPRRTVGQILRRAMERHGTVESADQQARVAELLERVGLAAADAKKYSHEFSGGQQQRIAIAHALAVEPKLIVCDEPVSALDVSVQAQILNLLADLQDELGLTYLFISHDISVVRHICDRVAVMYLGEIVEKGPVERIFAPPYHPYTEKLLTSVPQPTPGEIDDEAGLSGDVPSPVDPPTGCSFHTRCPKKISGECDRVTPTLESAGPDDAGHEIACHLSTEEMDGPTFD